MNITRKEVLRLYRNLLMYSKSLKLTDPDYFRRSIKIEFKNNQNLTDLEKISFAYQKGQALLQRGNFSPRLAAAFKHTIDYSKVPKINECELSEKFVRGSGPGGSAVNKNSNCVVLTHIPTGTVIKCHTSRCQDDNRKKARELLIEKLDDMINGPESVSAQRKLIEEKKYKRNATKKQKISKLKDEWKKREGII